MEPGQISEGGEGLHTDPSPSPCLSPSSSLPHTWDTLCFLSLIYKGGFWRLECGWWRGTARRPRRRCAGQQAGSDTFRIKTRSTSSRSLRCVSLPLAQVFTVIWNALHLSIGEKISFSIRSERPREFSTGLGGKNKTGVVPYVSW